MKPKEKRIIIEKPTQKLPDGYDFIKEMSKYAIIYPRYPLSNPKYIKL